MNSQKVNRSLLTQRGFSLVEIMVVIVIIALIAGIVTTQVSSRLEKARVSAAKIQMKAFESALDEFRRDNGFYPTTAQTLQALITKPSTPPEPKNYESDGYLKVSTEEKEIPKDPWNNDYAYESETTNKYRLTCYGADGQAGGEDSAKDIVFAN